MTAPSSIDPTRFLHEQLGSASPDLLRSMLTTFMNTLMSAEADAVDAWTRNVSHAATEVRELIDGIASRTRELATGTEDFAAAAEQIAASTEELNASTEEITASAQHLANAAVKFTETVGIFRG